MFGRFCLRNFAQLVLITAGAAIADLAIRALRPEALVWAGAGAGMGAGSTSSPRVIIKSSRMMSKNSAMAFGPPGDFLSRLQKPSHAPPMKNFCEALRPFCFARISRGRGGTHTP